MFERKIFKKIQTTKKIQNIQTRQAVTNNDGDNNNNNNNNNNEE